MHDYLARPIDARIWGLHKRTLDFRIYVTDAAGRIVFDSGGRAPPGTDYSRWRDVLLTLRGEYGARATREVRADDTSGVMYVAAPINAVAGGPPIGVLTVAKPLATVQQFIDRAERKIFIAGAWLLALSLAIGVAVTQAELHFIDENEPAKSWEYAVLVCNTNYELEGIGQLYRDRADCENGFDEIKNQWGWGGYSTHDIERCALSARAVALVHNWWSWYVRLAHPKTRLEARRFECSKACATRH